MTGSPDVPEPDAVGFEDDPSLSVQENVERALSALDNHVDEPSIETAEEFVFRHVAGAGPELARYVIETSTDLEIGPDLGVHLFMGRDSPYAASPGEVHATGSRAASSCATVSSRR